MPIDYNKAYIYSMRTRKCSNLVYFGFTTQQQNIRFNEHMHAAFKQNRPGYNSKLSQYIREFGTETWFIKHEINFSCNSSYDLENAVNEYIKQYGKGLIIIPRKSSTLPKIKENKQLNEIESYENENTSIKNKVIEQKYFKEQINNKNKGLFINCTSKGEEHKEQHQVFNKLNNMHCEETMIGDLIKDFYGKQKFLQFLRMVEIITAVEQ